MLHWRRHWQCCIRVILYFELGSESVHNHASCTSGIHYTPNRLRRALMIELIGRGNSQAIVLGSSRGIDIDCYVHGQPGQMAGTYYGRL